MLSKLVKECLVAITKITTALLAICVLLFLRNATAGKQVVVEVDGKILNRKTKSKTVGELLKESEIKVAKTDIVSPYIDTPLASGMKVRVKRALPVIVVVEGKERKIFTTAHNVREALASNGIEFSLNDEIDPPLGSPIKAGMRIQITKVVVKEERISEPLAFRVIRQRDENLELGKKVVQRKGRSGLIERVFRVTYRGSEVVARELVQEVIKVRPLAEIVRIGTLRPFVVSRGQEDPGTREQGAAGEQVGSQPIAPTNSQEGFASYYTLNGKGIGMTAAHRTLPYGTKVRVTNLSNGRQVEVVINDRGPFKRGRIIDLATDAFRAIASTSQGVCRVRIEW